FSLTPESRRMEGLAPRPEDMFWTEARFGRSLAEGAGWSSVSDDDKVKILFHYAQEEIRAARRKLRDVHLFWTPTSAYASGPPVDPKSIEFPNAPAVPVDPEDPQSSSRFRARAGAGH
ncbi:MAG TPA: hypothetical protein VK116_06905, partial [Planctomycetota bacterium]|nr:hypothetical protein [Planctomycetota bacterium]